VANLNKFFLWETSVEKYGSIQCPECKSMDVVEEGSEKIAVEHTDLIKTASQNVGSSFLCQSCKHRFNQVTGSCAKSPEGESVS
jgi:transposase-like protein